MPLPRSRAAAPALLLLLLAGAAPAAAAPTDPLAPGGAEVALECQRVYLPAGNALYLAAGCEGRVAAVCSRVANQYGPCAELFEDGCVYVRVLNNAQRLWC